MRHPFEYETGWIVPGERRLEPDPVKALLAWVRHDYTHDSIGIDELEQRVADALQADYVAAAMTLGPQLQTVYR